MNRPEALGLAIREARLRINLSQERLAEAAQLHRNVVGKLERNLSSPTIASLFAIADALNVRASELVARAEELAAEGREDGDAIAAEGVGDGEETAAEGGGD